MELKNAKKRNIIAALGLQTPTQWHSSLFTKINISKLLNLVWHIFCDMTLLPGKYVSIHFFSDVLLFLIVMPYWRPFSSLYNLLSGGNTCHVQLRPKTEAVHLWSHPHTASNALRTEAAGQPYKQTTEFVYLGGAISESADLDIEIKRRIGAAWASVRNIVPNYTTDGMPDCRSKSGYSKRRW